MSWHYRAGKLRKRKRPAFVDLSICLVLLSLAASAQVVLAQAPDARRIIIKFRQDSQLLKLARGQSAAEDSRRVISNPSAIHSALGVVRLRPLKADAHLDALPGGVERIFVASLADSVDVGRALAISRGLKEIEYAETASTNNTVDAVILVPSELQASEGTSSFPNDPYFPQQWALHNTGTNAGTTLGIQGADLAMLPAWQITTGSSGVVVAFLSSGIRSDVYDFGGRVLRTGYNFVGDNNDVADDNGIGTAIASMTAATGNNSYAITGVNWSCEILPVKILGPEFGLTSVDRLARGLVYAADKGADVICIPIYGDGSSKAFHDAIAYAASSGAIIVASAPYGWGIADQEAFRKMILVGPVNCRAQRTQAHRGLVDFMAPGLDVQGISQLYPNYTWKLSGPYPAPALAAGVISLMLGLDKSLTFEEVYDILKESATDQIGYSSEDKPGWDEYYGWGMINAYRALRLVRERSNEIPESFGVSQNYPNPFNSSTVIEYQLKYPMQVLIKVYNVLGQPVATLVDGEQRAGYHHARWDAKVASGVYFYRLEAGNRVIMNKMILAK